MVIANATVLQVANAIEAIATLYGVAEPLTQIQEFRRVRLSELLEHPDFAGNQAKLGDVMGLTSGAYVRQLLAGERPITEKGAEKITAMHGGKYKNWLDPDPAELALVARFRELRGHEDLRAKATEFLDALSVQARLLGESCARPAAPTNNSQLAA